MSIRGCDTLSLDADICGQILSIKNPHAGIIRADSVGEIIQEDSIMDSNAQIIIKK